MVKQSRDQIGVLVPAYRAGDTIDSAVHSILQCRLAQQGRVHVIVAPDDDQPQTYAHLAQIPGVTVLPATYKQGPGATRNRAYRALPASVNYLTMLDADDSVSAGYLDRLHAAATGHPHGIAFSRTRYTRQGKPIRDYPAQGAVVHANRFAAFAGSLHALYHRRHWIDYEDGLAEDVIHDAHMLERSGLKAPLVSRAVYQATLHPQSLCATSTQERFNQRYLHVVQDRGRTEFLRRVFCVKLSIGILYEERRGKDLGFHDYLRRVGQQ